MDMQTALLLVSALGATFAAGFLLGWASGVVGTAVRDRSRPLRADVLEELDELPDRWQ
jgi:hypothetical protein